MKKKHRDIVVDGKKYGWTVSAWQYVRIWYDKKIIAEYKVPEIYDVTPKIVAALISDPENTMLWLNAKPCPFCGEKVIEVGNESEYYKDTLICNHKEDCWLHRGTRYTLIRKSNLETWNKRC